MRHRNADLIKQYIEDTSLPIWYWNYGEGKWERGKPWQLLASSEVTIMAVGEVPEGVHKKRVMIGSGTFTNPVMYPLTVGTRYYLADRSTTINTSGTREALDHEYIWEGNEFDLESLALNIVHLSIQEAHQHYLAMQMYNIDAVQRARGILKTIG